ncbi:hypothetical protein HPB48_000273 [Haemaphysalis longicornis]|uniref:Uncharacterized protein n=1 Tax=Haemaphysalis longicornis TaxID=44386 RepID=A0A9J6FID1_HAELO|nr:hypothetical protein HPB48_000273 [Haemaphysalis longicornis]
MYTTQVNEVGNSVRMELEGLKRGLEFLLRNNSTIAQIVTDRHTSIRAFLKREHPAVLHLFDCWHVAKGIKKKLLAASKCRGLEELAKWSQATVNHLYWCAMSSDGHPEQILPKWTSLGNHVINVHEHESRIFPHCAHGDLSGDERLWLNEGSDAHRKLREVVCAPSLVKDVPQLSTKKQTYSCEAFHSLINQFAPKTYHYSHGGMQARVAIASMHYNENNGRTQATTATGKQRFAIRFRKSQSGEASLTAIKEPPTYGYIRSLLECTLHMCTEYKTYKEAFEATKGPAPPPPTTAGRDRPSLDVLCAMQRTRFNK